MSCKRMEERILGYLDGRLKQSEHLEMEKHLSECGACSLRANEFRAVSGLLEELPKIEPSPAFDVRVRARVAAEPVKQSWWSWMTLSPRVAVAASLLLAATMWIGTHSIRDRVNVANSGTDLPGVESTDLPVLENYDLLSNFEPLTELPQPVQADETNQPKTPQQM